MSDHPLTEDYLQWLVPQLRDEEDRLSHPEREFWGLGRIMYEKEFRWHVPNDGNRLMDGLELRREFCDDHRVRMSARRREPFQSFLDKENPNPPCSFLEVLIALSRRYTFTAGGKNAPGWAWILLSNLNLHRMYDPLTRGKARRARDILDVCIKRDYAPDGQGGFFPLENPLEDQTQVEIWYQMAAYVMEKENNRGW
jgi:hypothetical protein